MKTQLGRSRLRVTSYRTLTAALAMSLCGACAVSADGTEAELGTAAAALHDELTLPSVPSTPVPAGLGTYCSVTDATNGGWALLTRGPGGDPCGELASKVGPATVIRRAGLWSVSGTNNAMARCDGNVLSVRRGTGDSAISGVFADAQRVGGKNCYFAIAPTRMPIFGFPYDTSAHVTGTTVFGYDFTGKQLMTGDFGRFPSVPVCQVDRTGFGSQGCNGGPRPWQPYTPPYGSDEAAYDWTMARDTPIIAMADGVVRGAQARPLPGLTPQLEVFIESQVGTGTYAEHFVAAYHHMDPAPFSVDPVKMNQIIQHITTWNAGWAALGKPALPLAPPGTVVKRGDVVGYNGTSGNSSSYHLDLSVHRLTNLSDARAYAFKSSPDPAVFPNGINGWPGQIDPFGWAAPAGIDPLAFRFLDKLTEANPIHLGAFSINLWANPPPDGYATPQSWPLWPPTNGGASW